MDDPCISSFSYSFRCKKCKGERTVKEKTRQEIYIERGMPDGYRIVLTGAGDQEVSFSTIVEMDA